MMSNRKPLIALALAVALLPLAPLFAGPAEDAKAAAEKGNVLLKKADFAGALKEFAAAAKADTANAAYRQKYSVVKQVIALRESLAAEKDDAKWQQTARKLNGFYSQNGLYAEALPLGKRLHELGKNADTAAGLAGTLLALDQNAGAEKLLSGPDAVAATPLTNTLLGIALARQSKLDAAKAVAAKIELPKDAGPGLLYNLACVKSLIGQKQEAAALLTRVFENTPPSRLDAIKNEAREDKDLAGVVKTPEFAVALKTASKVKESGCSGGPDCGSCPSRGKCEPGKEKPADKVAKEPADKK